LLSVFQCNAITFGPGELQDRPGDFIDMQGESISSVLLSGYASKNVYDQEGNPKPKDFMA
jgi:hypothetical protein